MSNGKSTPTTRPRAATTNDIMERRNQRRKNRGKGAAIADWQSVDPNILQSLIAEVTKHGTITFGYTRDGGAYYLAYWVDGVSDKEYIRPTEDVDGVLHAELESWK